MSTKPIKPRLADNLRLLVASQLQIQAAQSVALARKGPLFNAALMSLVLAILIELTGRVLQ
jgi:hypothetical protein